MKVIWNQRIWGLIVVLAMIFCGAGCSNSTIADGYVPPLEITGDVSQPLIIRDVSDLEWTEFRKGEASFQGLPLQDLIAAVEPVSDQYDVYLTAPDGLAAKLNGSGLDSSYIVLSNENGWEAIHLYHPPSAAVKHMGRIVVVCKTDRLDQTVNIVKEDSNLIQLSPGKMFADGLQEIPIAEGTSEQEVDGKKYGVSVYTRRLGVPVRDIPRLKDVDNYLVVGKEGKVVQGTADAFIQWQGSQLRYVSANGRITVDNLAGIFINPPKNAITDLYSITNQALDQSQKVLIILLDGFGYHQYVYAKENGFAPYLSSLPDAVPALASYQPVTNAGMAAMLTGQWPNVNGVFSRKQREMKVPTLFAYAMEKDKDALLLEGPIGILKTEIEPTLHLDDNLSGDSDDEILASALDKIGDGPDLLMVHFHSIDDAGHDSGDLHPTTMETIRRNDQYVRALVEEWDGKVIILADHGMHAETIGGAHGVFRYEDMLVPLIITEGGNTP